MTNSHSSGVGSKQIGQASPQLSLISPKLLYHLTFNNYGRNVEVNSGWSLSNTTDHMGLFDEYRSHDSMLPSSWHPARFHTWWFQGQLVNWPEATEKSFPLVTAILRSPRFSDPSCCWFQNWGEKWNHAWHGVLGTMVQWLNIFFVISPVFIPMSFFGFPCICQETVPVCYTPMMMVINPVKSHKSSQYNALFPQVFYLLNSPISHDSDILLRNI